MSGLFLLGDVWQATAVEGCTTPFGKQYALQRLKIALRATLATSVTQSAAKAAELSPT